MAMFVIGWFLTGAIFSFGGIVILRHWCNHELTYGDLFCAGGVSLFFGPFVIFGFVIAAYVELTNRLDRSNFWETPVFKKDK